MQRSIIKILSLAIVATLIFGFHCVVKASAADDPKDANWDTFEVLPLRAIHVKGDAAKFRPAKALKDAVK